MFCSLAVTEFKRLTVYPHGGPGYVIDHIVPLALSGADTPADIQRQARLKRQRTRTAGQPMAERK